ncbi:DUF4153 domain-containing protein [Paenibacillus agri]|uniref:DUF4173 domain-containing protein n=1 Tax=Paenibacillus agri TaxID=2744309 RepID=A0A850ETC8_9BACL|nr:DUF4173 domain-containing protein [Paenibacillus agri]NUU64115.1 DUF4173 domain-containing protein [Paenibacillus agri]
MSENEVRRIRPLVVLGAAFLLAIIHQYLFFGAQPGISYPIFVTLFYVFILYYAREQRRPFSWFSYLWLAAIGLLSLTYVLFQDMFFFGFNLLVIPILILLHMTYMLGADRLSWGEGKLIVKTLEHFLPQNFRHWATAFAQLRSKQGGKIKDERKQVLIKVLIGLTISCPILLVVVSLLSSADGVFLHLVQEFPNILGNLSLGEGFVRVMWVLLFGLGFFGFVWGFVDPKDYSWNARNPALKQLNMETPELPVFRIDPVIMATILISINMVYVLFVFVQFSYLFGAWEGILPTGSTYADYARSGFFELVMVTGINFILLMLCLLPSGEGQGLLRRITRVLLYILVACSGVMLYSAFTRLSLYEEAYGYTYTRFLVHAFMIFLGLLLGLAALRIGSKKISLAKCYIVLGLVSYVVMNYICLDVIVANKNIERYVTSGKLDADYLFTLSPQAIPTLIDFSRSQNGILDNGLRREWEVSQSSEKWQSFNVSRYRAEHELKEYFKAETK